MRLMVALAVALVLAPVLAGCMQAGGGQGPEAGDAPTLRSGLGSPETTSTSRTTTAAAPAQGSSGTTGPQPSSTSTSSTGTASPPQNASQNQTHDPQPFEPSGPAGSCGAFDSLTPVAPDPTLAAGLATGWPMLELTYAVLADPAFVAAHPAEWQALLRDLVADSSALFEDQVGVRFNLTIVDRLPDGSLAPGVGDGQQRAVARGYMEANHPQGADLVAVILGADYEGTTAGQVECVHGAGYPGYNYLWAEYDGDRGSTAFIVADVFTDTPLKVFTHETGHLLAAHHHYSNCGEALVSFAPDDALAVCDVMINDVGLASLRFGPANRLVMRSYVEEIGIGDPA